MTTLKETRVSSRQRAQIDSQDSASWHAVVEAAVRSRVPPSVVLALRNVPAERMYADTAQYLKEALQKANAELLESLLSKLEAAVCAGFSTVRAFHGCKPVSLDSYHQNGIRPLDPEWLVRETFDVFEGTIPVEEIQRRVAKSALNGRQGLIYFVTDPDVLTERSGYYLIYGPESLNCLWGNDPSRQLEMQHRQRKRGIPTLFECAVPLTQIGSKEKRQLTKTLVTRYFQGRSTIPEPDSDVGAWGLTVSGPIRPVDIVGHTHPAKICDPLGSRSTYHNPVTRCPWCP